MDSLMDTEQQPRYPTETNAVTLGKKSLVKPRFVTDGKSHFPRPMAVVLDKYRLDIVQSTVNSKGPASIHRWRE